MAIVNSNALIVVVVRFTASVWSGLWRPISHHIGRDDVFLHRVEWCRPGSHQYGEGQRISGFLCVGRAADIQISMQSSGAVSISTATHWDGAVIAFPFPLRGTEWGPDRRIMSL